VAKDRAPKFSFDEGLQVLPDQLAEILGDSVQRYTSVTKLRINHSGWTVYRESAVGKSYSQFDAVIFCGTAPKLAELELEIPAVVNLNPFSEIRYPPVASVVLGFRRNDVAHDCCGFGMLIPKIEGFKSLGTIFSSALFPNRAPADHHTLTTYIGGERYPELALLAEAKLVELVCADLKILLGVRGTPTFQHVVVYPRAIPQYNVGYGRYKELMDQIEQQAPGFYFAGHYRDGVSLSDSIVSGINVAERVAALQAMRDQPRAK